MTDKQRKSLLNLCEMLGDPYASPTEHDDADAIRSVMAEIDALTGERDALLALARTHGCADEPDSDGEMCGCRDCVAWRANYGGRP